MLSTACVHAVRCILQRRRDAIRLCQHIVSAQCLQQRLPEDCIAELSLSQAAGGGSGATEAAVGPAGPGPDPPRNVVAIAVPVAIAGWSSACQLATYRWQLVSFQLCWACMLLGGRGSVECIASTLYVFKALRVCWISYVIVMCTFLFSGDVQQLCEQLVLLMAVMQPFHCIFCLVTRHMMSDI